MPDTDEMAQAAQATDEHCAGQGGASYGLHGRTTAYTFGLPVLRVRPAWQR